MLHREETFTLPDGRTLGCLMCGAEDGFPVFCFHGFPGCRLDYAGFAQPAARRGLLLISPDRPGIGLSSPQPGRTLLDAPKDVKALADALDLPRFALYGVSGGGPYALACAWALPERAVGAVVAGGLGPLEDDRALDGMNLSNRALFSVAKVWPRAVRLSVGGTAWLMGKHPSWYLRAMNRVLPKSDRDRLGRPDGGRAKHTRAQSAQIFAQGPDAVAEEAVLYTRPWGFSPADIAVPVHFFHGEEDKNVPIRAARLLSRQIRGSVRHFCRGEGHMITGTHAGEIFSLLASFFEHVRTVDSASAPVYDRNHQGVSSSTTEGGSMEVKQREEDQMDQNYQINTKCVQAGYEPKNGEPRVLPIYQSTTYKYDTAAELGKLFDLEADGFFYTRLANPTLDAVEKKIAALEGGVGAVLTSSGQAASLLAVTNICRAGDHVVCASAIYGGTFNLFHKTLRELGIDFTFMAPDATEEEISAAIKENTRCVFTEALSNPALVVTDIEAYARAAHAHGIPLIVDNTFPTPVNCRPIEFGADIVVHSTSKYMDGHAVALGGVVVDSGNFNWNNGKFPGLTEPDESYHGVRYTERFGRAAYIVKARTHLMRDLGPQQSPQNAFLLNLGLETLFLRVERHCRNALAVARHLEGHEKISWINYPGLESSPYHALAQKYMPNGSCGVISFGVKGGREAAAKFMESLKLAAIVVHVADARTSVLHPASTTHRQMTDEQLVEAGVSADLIRMSVGIEHIDDIIADIDQALAAL